MTGHEIHLEIEDDLYKKTLPPRRGRLAQWKTVRFVNFVRGDRGSIPAKGDSFQTRINSQVCLTETFRHLDGFFQSTQPRLEKAVAAYLLSEEERSLGNWSYDVTAVGTMTSYTLLRNSTTTLAT